MGPLMLEPAKQPRKQTTARRKLHPKKDPGSQPHSCARRRAVKHGFEESSQGAKPQWLSSKTLRLRNYRTCTDVETVCVWFMDDILIKMLYLTSKKSSNLELLCTFKVRYKYSTLPRPKNSTLAGKKYRAALLISEQKKTQYRKEKKRIKIRNRGVASSDNPIHTMMEVEGSGVESWLYLIRVKTKTVQFYFLLDRKQKISMNSSSRNLQTPKFTFIKLNQLLLCI